MPQVQQQRCGLNDTAAVNMSGSNKTLGSKGQEVVIILMNHCDMEL